MEISENPTERLLTSEDGQQDVEAGEKLYVTADKRGEKGSCKRPLCWTLLGLVVAAIVAIIVLAATGVLFTNSPTPLEQYNTSVSSARALGGIGHVHHDHDHNHDHDHEHEHDHSNHEHSPDHDHTSEPTLQHGPEPQSDEGHEPNINSDEIGDSTMYVPRTVEGELKVDNEEFTAELQDPESNEYREFVNTFSDGLKRALFDRASQEDNEITIEIIQLRKGSVIVTYRIHWKPKTSTEPTEDLLNSNKLGAKLDEYLATNNRMINVYHIAEDKLTTRPVLDICQINKNGCEHDCEFDEMNLEFTCTCPPGQILDMANQKRCMSLLDAETIQRSEDDARTRDFTVLTVNNPSTTQMPSEQKPVPEPAQQSENNFDWKETHHRMPETTTESEPDVNFSHIFGHPTDKPEHEPKPDSSEDIPAPEPTPEPKSETELEQAPEHPVPEPTAEPEPQAEPEPEPKSEPEPEPEPKSEPEPTAEPEPEPKSEPEPEPEPEPKSEPEPEPKAEPEATPEPKSEPEPEPVTTTQSAAHVGLNSAFMHEDHQHEPQPTVEPEPTPEPQAEPEPSQTTEKSTTTDSDSETENEHGSEQDNDAEAVTESTKPTTTTTETNSENEHHADQAGNSEEKLILYTNEGKFLYKPNEETESETTTMRISISEPNLINEPSYEPKPEIISIFSNLPAEQPATQKNESEVTDWLEHQSQSDEKLHEKDNQNHTEFEDLLNNNLNKIMHESEQRSFKSFDDDFLFETTTSASPKTTNVDELIESITKSGVTTENEMSPKVDDEKMPSSDLAASDEKPEDFKMETTTAMTSEGHTTENAKSDSDMSDSETEEDEPEVKKGPLITSILEEAKSIQSNKTESFETTTVETETVQQFSIRKHYHDSDEDKLMEVLENKPRVETNETSTDHEPEEGMDITFDAINSLYNRSSKSIENQSHTQHSQGKLPVIEDTTEDNEPMGDTTGSTTDSDWLSEPVTEVNYDEAMNKMEKHETTESSSNKMDEIMNRGLVKDDFEPDYLNNMGGSGSMKQDQDEPLYGMVHDYDNEDSRFKRVNKEITTETPKEMVTTVVVENGNESKTTTEAIGTTNASPAPVETTTVSEYIYKVAEQTPKTMEINLPVHNETRTETTTLAPETETVPTMDTEPAPVWEDLDADKDLTVKELPKPMEQPVATTPTNVKIEEINMPSTTAATTVAPTNTENVTNAEPTNSDLSNQSTLNSTQSSNLNVTIYEISSHDGNNTATLKSTSTQSAEYDDHETEMNPFLPEVENNKSLVKKLQEGHDLEPTNLTETQNENAEEHALTTETQTSSNKDTLAVLAKDEDIKKPEETVMATTEDDTSFNELLMNVNSPNNKTEANKTVTDSMQTLDKPSENSRMMSSNEKPAPALPISTFLMDTDDLVTSREVSTTTSSNKLDGEPASAMTTEVVPGNIMDNGFLSVVPIVEDNEDQLEQKSENIEDNNDISDLPKSDKRTLDATRFDSVINNEA
ncbi:flocculation protein FLO11-like isoform X2 [Trichoplusia ni]|uniref:Flocculation protein FLO11-like isoform X2 n=1 Tax=Trichoplusia ni TaxID=7111 RepID=A0A7E5VDU3_TRINI|nr:flocculation protein FLO11-like isoform X2 [Trichoplusia ni]